jgi:hypothetical protein
VKFISLTLLIALWISCPPLRAALPEDTDDSAPSPGQKETIVPAKAGHEVVLTPQQQALSGLVSRIPKKIIQNQEYPCFGRVINIQSLLDLRARHREAKANLDVLNANLALAVKNRSRIKALFDAKVVPSRELVQVETQWQADQARQEAASLQEQSIRYEARYRWGQALADLALQEDLRPLESYLQHRLSVIEVTLPKGKTLDAGHSQIRVGRHFDRSLSVSTKIISPAPQTDEWVQGESWFLTAPGATFTAGMRIHAWVSDNTLIEGIEVPSSAIVWQGGRSWIYLERTPRHYERLPVDQRAQSGHHLAIVSGVDSGVPVVIVGAQTLLAEEFRHRIPAEDDDKE